MPPLTRKSDPQSETNNLAQFALRLKDRTSRLNVGIDAVIAQPTLNAALVFCVQASGLDRKHIYGALGIDAATWSRIESGQANFPLNKLKTVMDICGNEAPLMWLLDACGYDWESVREKQTEMERKVAELEQENTDLKRLFRLNSQMTVEGRS
jgi:hypothetical protein